MQLTCIMKPHTFVLIISKTSCCYRAIIAMKYNGKVKHLNQHYQLFQQVGRHVGKQFTYWLTDAKFNSVHVHVLIQLCSWQIVHSDQ